MTQPVANPSSGQPGTPGSPGTPARPRDYTRILASAPRGLPREAAMHWAVDALWDAFNADRLSWIGFYVKDPTDEMTLVARRDKPACSPIGLQGMCGRSWKERRPVLVDDVSALSSANYIACDPRDKSEVVIPLFEADGTCWGVLDGDSYDTHGFDEHDAAQLTRLVEILGLTAAGKTAGGVLRF